ncbi:MAG: CapA family protein [Clostridia bacterium]|nr:CapA family protein [Clostridia bacterium]
MKRALALALAALLCAAAPLATAEANPTLEPVQPLRSARIRAVGDLMAHQKQLDYALQADGSYDFHPQYALVADSLADADYTIANLETTIGKYGSMAYSGFPLFNSPEALLQAVKDAGVDFLTLANNHMLDRYYEGMLNTVNAVEAHGFDHGGANRSPEERDAPVVVEVNGIKLGMLCYTQMTNGMEDFCNSAVREFGINYMRKANYKQDVRKLRDAGAEVVIAMPHWGEEYFRRPEQNTVNQAKLLIAAGVDVILGSHPHMVQPVEFVTAKDDEGHERTGLVAYCLGNFISNMSKRYTDSGIILDFTLRERQDGSFAVEDVGCVPVFVWRQDGAIRALSSLQYYDVPPEGMASDRAERMRQSYRELRELIDDSIPMLAQ